MRVLRILAATILLSMVLTVPAFSANGEYERGKVKTFTDVQGLNDLISSHGWAQGRWPGSSDCFSYYGNTAGFNAFLEQYSRLNIGSHTLVLQSRSNPAAGNELPDWELAHNALSKPPTVEITLRGGGKVDLDKVIVPPNVEIAVGSTLTGTGYPKAYPEVRRFVARHEATLGIYLLSDKNPTKFDDLKSKNLRDLNLQSTPLLTMDDFVSYSQNTHQLRVKEDVVNQVPFHRMGTMPRTRMFVLFTGGKRTCLGAFSSVASNYIPPGSLIITTDPFFFKDNVIGGKRVVHEDTLIQADFRNDPAAQSEFTNTFKSAGKLK